MLLTVYLDTWVIIHRNILQNFSAKSKLEQIQLEQILMIRAKYKPLTIRAKYKPLTIRAKYKPQMVRVNNDD